MIGPMTETPQIINDFKRKGSGAKTGISCRNGKVGNRPQNGYITEFGETTSVATTDTKSVLLIQMLPQIEDVTIFPIFRIKSWIHFKIKDKCRAKGSVYRWLVVGVYFLSS